MKIALCQMKVENKKDVNLIKAREMLRRAAVNGAELVILPEMFYCPYDHEYFTAFAEDESGHARGKSLFLLAEEAKENGIWIVGGTVPYRETGDKIYNTCFVWNNRGEVVTRYHKVHLFDIDLSEGARFKESATFNYGNDISLFDIGSIRIGLGICYDLRFPEFARLLSLGGAEFVIFPAAFTRVTGEAHWELLLRTRAVDNQLFIAGVSPAPNPSASFQAYGHSMVVDPWGRVLASLGEEEDILIIDLDLPRVSKIRREMPLLAHRRTDLYRIMGCGLWHGKGDINDNK